jgi:N6-adenosine-specific RNA methylase IME4
MELKINPEFRDLIPPLTKEETDSLTESIKNEGCYDAIKIWDGFIVDGHNRYRICTENNIKFSVSDWYFKDDNEAKLWIIKNQFARRNLNPFQRSELALKMEPLIAAQAKERMLKGVEDPAQNSAEGVKETRAEVARLAGTSHDTIMKVKFIKDNAEQDLIEKVRSGEESIHAAYKKTIKEKHQNEFIQPQIPEGKYNIIYADPPWDYWAGGWKNATQHYKTMGIEDIRHLPITEMAADDCILFMWATFPQLPEALTVLETWGFKYSTVGFVWVKSLKDGSGFHFGCGNWTRANVELCIIATKGHIERKDASISQVIYSPVEEHSKKPDIVRDKIIQLVGDMPRIELFARQKSAGWKSWGNEIKE